MLVATADPRIDIALRSLTAAVSGAIVATLFWYLFVLLAPYTGFSREEVGPPAWAAGVDTAAMEPSSAEAALPEAPVVQVPSRSSVVTVYRCEAGGRVTYTDRPCDRGGMRVLRLPQR
jgi:hypothetical protein